MAAISASSGTRQRIADSGAEISPICQRCTLNVPETDLHRSWTCPANRHLDGLDLGILVAGPRTAARRSSRATLAAAADAAKQAAADVIIDCERKARASRAEIGGEDGARVVQAGAARVAARAGRRRSIR